jgi:hypothetical protein
MTCLDRNILSVHIVGMQFNLSFFPDNMIHVPGFHGGDAGVLKLNVVLPHQRGMKFQAPDFEHEC